MSDAQPYTIGVISDTHGLLRAEAVQALQGVQHILHAGDVGDPAILNELARIAPTTAVRGNVDRAPWAQQLRVTETVDLNGVWVYVLHDRFSLELDPQAAGFAAVISGHSHQPLIQERNGVLFLNPGSAGPRRFRLPVTLAHLSIDPGGQVSAEIVTLL